MQMGGQGLQGDNIGCGRAIEMPQAASQPGVQMCFSLHRLLHQVRAQLRKLQRAIDEAESSFHPT